MYVQIVVF